MARTGGYDESNGAAIPAPRVIISEEDWSVTNAHGDALRGQRAVYLQAFDCPNDFFDDPDLDARIELLRFNKHRHEQAKNNRGESAWRHPDCSVNPITGARSRGGAQVVPRQSSWLLHGNSYDDHSMIGRVKLEDYFYIRQIRILTGLTGSTPQEKFVRVPVVSGSRQVGGIWTISQLNPDSRLPRYHGQALNQYFRFRISIVNLDGDGTKGDRLVGPMSETYRVSPYPYPVWPLGDGFADGENTNRLSVAPHQGAMGQ